MGTPYTHFVQGVMLVLFLAAMPAGASAQQLGGQRFVPASSEDGVLGTEGAERRRQLAPYATLWLTYALDPVVVLDEMGEEAGPLIEHLLAAHLVASINLFAGLDVGVAAPFALVQSGDDAVADQAGIARPGGAAVGDLELRLAYRLHVAHATSLALHLPILLPTASEDDLLSLGLGVRPTLALQQGFDPLDLTVNLSYLIRGEERAIDYRGGDELGLRLALRAGLDDTWHTALLGEVGMVTQTADFFSAAGTPVEVRVGLEHWFSRHWRLAGFLGTGLSTGVGAPDLSVGVGLTFGEKPRRPRIVPLPGDRDADGILDDRDRCPDDPEDADGFADEDGCPDDDNDGDGILDVDDQCPNEPETFDDIADDDGCPDRLRVEGTLITTFEPVQFRTNSDEILPESHAMLREVASIMESNPDMQIRVEGHTDSQGDDDSNMQLSQRRADSVRRFIAAEGIQESRLESEGLGETRPVADNGTAEGRRKNRRVEFHIER